MIPQYPCLRLQFKDREDKCLERYGPCRAMAGLAPGLQRGHSSLSSSQIPFWTTWSFTVFPALRNNRMWHSGQHKQTSCAQRNSEMGCLIQRGSSASHGQNWRGGRTGASKKHLRNSKLKPSCFQLTLAWHKEWQKADWAGYGISRFNNWNVRYLYPPELLNVSYWQVLRVLAFLHSAHIFEKYSC